MNRYQQQKKETRVAFEYELKHFRLATFQLGKKRYETNKHFSPIFYSVVPPMETLSISPLQGVLNFFDTL